MSSATFSAPLSTLDGQLSGYHFLTRTHTHVVVFSRNTLCHMHISTANNYHKLRQFPCRRHLQNPELATEVECDSAFVFFPHPTHSLRVPLTLSCSHSVSLPFSPHPSPLSLSLIAREAIFKYSVITTVCLQQQLCICMLEKTTLV